VPTTQNLLTRLQAAEVFDSNGDRLSVDGYTTGWTTSANATLTVNDSEIQDLNYYTIRLNPNNTETVGLYLTSRQIPNATRALSQLVFHCLFRCVSAATATVSLRETGQPVPSPGAQTAQGVKYQYVVARSNLIDVPLDLVSRYYDMSVEFDFHNGDPIYVTVPCLIDDRGFYRNQMVKNARSSMPNVYWDKDNEQVNPTYPMFKLYDALTTTADDVMRTYSYWQNLELYEVAPGFTGEELFASSTLTDPNYVADLNREWLAQFTGSQLKNNVQGKNSSGTDREYFTTDEELAAYLTWQLVTSYYGHAGGTREAMTQAAKQVLTGTKGVGVIPNYLSDPWKIQIQTLQSETVYDSSNSDISADVLDAVEPTRPLGYQIFSTAVAQFVFIIGNVGLGILGQGQLG